MNDIKQKGAQYYITVLLNLGFAPLYWALLNQSFILFNYYRTASSGLVFG